MSPARTISREGVIQLVALVLAGSWIGFFLISGMPQLTLHVFPRTVAVHALFGALAAVYAVYLAAARRLPGGTPLDLPILGFLGAYVLATLTSINWRVSLEPTLQIFAAVIVFYALSGLPFLGATQLRRMLMLVGGALALYAIWIVGNDYADYLSLARRVEGLNAGNIFPPTVPRVHDVSDHPNVLAMLLTLIMPFYALAAVRPAAWWERIGGIAGFLAGALAIFLTLSRGGWLGVGVGVGVTLAGTWMTAQADARERQGFAPTWKNALPRDVSPTAIAALVGALVLAAIGTLAFLSSSATRPGWLFRGSLSPREDAWDAGLDIFRDNPLAGAGPHTFGLLYPQYSGKFLVHTQHAHNGFLQVADDAGLIGLAALAALGIAAAYLLIAAWREGDLQQRFTAIACAGALAGFSAHNQLDAGSIWKAPPIALAVVGAIIACNYRERAHAREERAPAPYRRYAGLAVRAALVLVVALPFIVWYRIDAAHYDFYRGVDAANQGEAGALERLQDAVDADSSMTIYRLQLGQLQAQIFDQTGRSDRALIAAAVVNLEQAKRLDTRSDIVRANLARAYQLAGRFADAAHEAQITRLAGNHVAPVIAVAEVYEDMEYEAEAIDTYGEVVSMDAGLADSEFWQGSAWRRDHFDEIIAASSLGVNPCTFGAYIAQAHRSDPRQPVDRLAEAEQGCKLLVLSSPNDLVLRVALAKILGEQGKADDAFVHLDYAVNRQPDFGPARTELGRWYADRGDLDEARRQWVTGSELDEAESVMLLGDSYPATSRPAGLRSRLEDLLATTGSSVQNDVVSVLYYRLRFGRISPVYAIVPGDWQTAVPRIYAQMQETARRWDEEAGE